MKTVTGEVEILLRQRCAGSDIQHHQVIKRVSTHPQEQRLFIALYRFIIKEGECPAGFQPVIAQQAATAVRDARQHKFKAGTR